MALPAATAASNITISNLLSTASLGSTIAPKTPSSFETAFRRQVTNSECTFVVSTRLAGVAHPIFETIKQACDSPVPWNVVGQPNGLGANPPLNDPTTTSAPLAGHPEAPQTTTSAFTNLVNAPVATSPKAPWASTSIGILVIILLCFFGFVALATFLSYLFIRDFRNWVLKLIKKALLHKTKNAGEVIELANPPAPKAKKPTKPADPAPAPGPPLPSPAKKRPKKHSISSPVRINDNNNIENMQANAYHITGNPTFEYNQYNYSRRTSLFHKKHDSGFGGSPEGPRRKSASPVRHLREVSPERGRSQLPRAELEGDPRLAYTRPSERLIPVTVPRRASVERTRVYQRTTQESRRMVPGAYPQSPRGGAWRT